MTFFLMIFPTSTEVRQGEIARSPLQRWRFYTSRVESSVDFFFGFWALAAQELHGGLKWWFFYGFYHCRSFFNYRTSRSKIYLQFSNKWKMVQPNLTPVWRLKHHFCHWFHPQDGSLLLQMGWNHPYKWPYTSGQIIATKPPVGHPKWSLSKGIPPNPETLQV